MGEFSSLEEVAGVLSSGSLRLSSERELQDDVQARLAETFDDVRREHSLSARSRIDHAVFHPDGTIIGVECKLRADRTATVRQCRRYLDERLLDGIVIVTQTSLPFVSERAVIVRASGFAGIAG